MALASKVLEDQALPSATCRGDDKGDDVEDRKAIEEALGRLGSADEASFDVFEAAMLLGLLDTPDADIGRCRAHVADLIERARIHADTAADQAQGLAQLFHAEAGYDGDRQTYDHPDNANILRVIERRRGLPVALGLLYIHVGERAGLHIAGLDVPGHFVVRLTAQGERVILDPFHGGTLIDAAGLRDLLKAGAGPRAELSPGSLHDMSKRAVLMRLQNNLKTRALAARQTERAAEYLARMTLIAPGTPELWFERGVIEEQLERLTAAVDAYEQCRARAVTSRMRESAATALSRLRRRLN